jgi:hypothetical protein
MDLRSLMPAWAHRHHPAVPVEAVEARVEESTARLEALTARLREHVAMAAQLVPEPPGPRPVLPLHERGVSGERTRRT